MHLKLFEGNGASIIYDKHFEKTKICQNIKTSH